MQKRILLIGYNFHPELTGIGKYSGEMVEWLAKKGYLCTVITAYPYYPHWKVAEPYHKGRLRFTTETYHYKSEGKITICRCPMYIPAQPSGIKRIFLDLSFSVTALLRIIPLALNTKYDLVIAVAPSFQFGLLGALGKKLFNAKFQYHVQDLQIEAARDLRMITSKRVLNLLFRCEKYIFNQADYISSISETMIHKIQKKAGKQVRLFPNWTDVQAFYPIADKETLKKKFGFSSSDKVVLYSGAIGEKQGLEAILYAAKTFQSYQEVKFVLCGSGPYKKNLEELAQYLTLDNVVFLPLQPVDEFNNFLNLADVHLVIQKATAGDLVMPSKLSSILAVGGLALVTANRNSGLRTLVEQYAMGVVVDAESATALHEGLRSALYNDHAATMLNARSYAEQHLSIENVMQQFEASILNQP